MGATYSQRLKMRSDTPLTACGRANHILAHVRNTFTNHYLLETRDEKIAALNDMLAELDEAMRPIRSIQGRFAWGCSDAGERAEVTFTSRQIQRERRRITNRRARVKRSQQEKDQYGRIGRAKYRERNYGIVREIKAKTPCADCGTIFPAVAMDFDHGDQPKDKSIAALCSMGAGLDRLYAEIAKCELVCANCHRVRTHG